MELVLKISDIPLLIFGDSQITSIFAQKKVFLQFSPKYRDVLCAANLCYSFTYFRDNAIDFRTRVGVTCIFENNGEKSCKHWFQN